ncbi:TPR repeat-containing protein [mine drainage metagenome]|uniref:TPR repeat-containing protein n=1 Tax=mine drainage metagenome TaxID=410659 RepID=T1DD18_9ZZZZ
MNKHQDALTDYTEAVRLNSMDQIFVYRRYELLMVMEKIDEALKDIETAISLVPNNYNYHLIKAETLAKMGHKKEALEAFEEASSYISQPELIEEKRKELEKLL